MRTFKILTLISMSLSCLGCASMTSTMLNRQDSDDYCVNEICNHQHTKGVPITLKVLTHVDVKITEEYALQPTANGLEEVDFHRRNLDFDVTPILTKKVFTVDFKKPGSGTLDYNATFKDQYFESIKNKIVDETIQDITSTLNRIGGLIPKPVAGKQVALNTSVSEEIIDSLVIGKRDVAFRRFDVNDPNFEQNLQAFVDHHLNNCHNCESHPSQKGLGVISDNNASQGDSFIIK